MSGQQSCHIYYRASRDKSKLREGGGGGEGGRVSLFSLAGIFV